ncbi:MAG: carbamoyl-phosphate synthase large subunit, partial [Gammaproteobacteria bacterium]
SRTVPFVSKATGLPLAKLAALCMTGQRLSELGAPMAKDPAYFSVKEAVFPFAKFPGVDPLLGPEMKSTGEVMGIGATFGEAFAKSQQAAGMTLPTGGTAFISVRERDKPQAVELARSLVAAGFRVLATRGTAKVLGDAGIACQPVNKVLEGQPHVVDMIKNGAIDFIINTTEGELAIADSFTIRRSALQHKIAYTTTMAGATAAVMALAAPEGEVVRRLQHLHEDVPI